LTPPAGGGPLRAAIDGNCFFGILPPVDLRAVCFVRAILDCFKDFLQNFTFLRCELFDGEKISERSKAREEKGPENMQI
jgi:hypothetical protein